MKTAFRPVDAHIEAPVAAAAAGDEKARQELWRAIEPWLLRLIAQSLAVGPAAQGGGDLPVVSPAAYQMGDEIARGGMGSIRFAQGRIPSHL